MTGQKRQTTEQRSTEASPTPPSVSLDALRRAMQAKREAERQQKRDAKRQAREAKRQRDELHVQRMGILSTDDEPSDEQTQGE